MVIWRRKQIVKGHPVIAEVEAVEIVTGWHLVWRTIVRGTMIERESPVYRTADQARAIFRARMVVWRINEGRAA